MSWARAILHVDMDAFFAAIVQMDHPETRGKPVLTGGRGGRGVVSTASYEARAFGCRSAMPMAQALRLCPQAIVMNPGPGRIRECSDTVMEVLGEFSPLVQPLSSDEAFVDVTGSIRLLGEPEAMAREIKRRITERTGAGRDRGLTASVGVACNKFLAKLGSELKKPDGLVVLGPELGEPGDEGSGLQGMLDPLPVSRIWGVGPKAEQRLGKLGVRTFGDLRAMPMEVLAGRLGAEWAGHLWRLCRGMDDRAVVADREAKSISHEQTFSENLRDAEDVRGVIMQQCEAVGRRLRRHGRTARTVTLKVRFGDFETVTRRATIGELEGGATDRTDVIWSLAEGLFGAWCAEPGGFRSVRLIGVGVSGLGGGLAGGDGDDDSFSDGVAGSSGTGSSGSGPAGGGASGPQGLLFSEKDGLGRDINEKQRAIDRATDRIAAKFGARVKGAAIARGRSITPGESAEGPESKDAMTRARKRLREDG